MVSTPLVEKVTELNINQDQHTACSSKVSKRNPINHLNNDTTYTNHSFSNEGSVSCLTQPHIFHSPKTGKVLTPYSSDDGDKTLPARQVNSPATLDPVAINDTHSREVPTHTLGDFANKKGTAVQVSTPAVTFPVELPHDGSEKLFYSSKSDEEDDVIEIASSKDKDSSKTSLFPLDDSIQQIKDCNMVNPTLYQDAVMSGGQ